MKYLKLFEHFDEYNFDNAKNNPDRIVVKFAPGGHDKFWNQYIKSTNPGYYRGLGNNWTYFGSWINLANPGNSPDDAKGLQMRDGVYYLLFKNYDPKDISDWRSGGRREGKLPATFYFLKYGKKSGEIGIFSSYGTEYQGIKPNDEFCDTNLKGNYQQNTYCRFDKGDTGRLVEPGSVDHIGYFEVLS